MAPRSSCIPPPTTTSPIHRGAQAAASPAASSDPRNDAMTIREFALERFFAKHEFSARHILGASDIEGMSLSELVGLADAECERLWRELRLGYTESLGH